jgi:hypothetical protein
MVIPDKDSMPVLDSVVLGSLLALTDPSSVFEFGTGGGSTTALFSKNVPAGVVTTLDLADDNLRELGDRIADEDRFVSEKHLPRQGYRIGRLGCSNVTLLNGNSRTYDLSAYAGTVDFVFIDGGHDVDTVQIDTQNALRMRNEARPSCIAWHDYGVPRFPDATKFLNDISETTDIIHVKDSHVCFQLHGMDPLMDRFRRVGDPNDKIEY